MPIEIRQLNIRSTVSDMPAHHEFDPAAGPGIDEQAMEQQKREIVAELKSWLDLRLRQRWER